MCSFLFTNFNITDLESVNFLNKRRGPDATNVLIDGEFNYVHNLLSITGDFTKQPLVDDDIIVTYNGEIYNYKNFTDKNSDGYSIVEVYRQNGINGLKELDGEFAIIIHDKKTKEIILVSDTFGTKPLYFSIENKKIGVSSYPKPLNELGFVKTTRIPPNTIMILDDSNFEIKKTKELYTFDLTQNVDTYDFWVNSFIDSIKKRTKTDLDILVPLSSGYDSGSICLILNEINKDYITCTIRGQENQTVLNNRISVNKNNRKEFFDGINNELISETKNEFIKYVQPFFYGPNPEEKTHEGFDDVGSIGLYLILKKMKEKYNVRIILSGHGSDEIMSNISAYGFKTTNPKEFNENLSDIFPWGNFYMGAQWSYLMKEECVAGSLGYETRYPFLDRKVVQSFLNLTPQLKNKNYKSPLHYLFEKYNYPFMVEKRGFQIL